MSATRIQLRRGTAAEWMSANPVLAEGEVGIELDSNKFKIGNGTTIWSYLPYAAGSTSTGVTINKVTDIPDVYVDPGVNGGVLAGNEILIYNAGAQRWDTRNNIISQDFDGGQY
jgi:hypothetical protein